VKTRRRASVALVATGAAFAVVLAAVAAAVLPAWQARADGAALYEGRQPLAARVSGHEQPLPAPAARCTNCHEGAQAIAPALNAGTLVHRLPRRGGPPSRYDAAALCRLLRDGVDPAWVTVPRAMPRYELDERSCATLWAYLSNR
jgi:hypothetical protein